MINSLLAQYVAIYSLLIVSTNTNFIFEGQEGYRPRTLICEEMVGIHSQPPKFSTEYTTDGLLRHRNKLFKPLMLICIHAVHGNYWGSQELCIHPGRMSSTWVAENHYFFTDWFSA